MSDLNQKYKTIVESIKLLCLPYSEQKKYVPDFTDIPFEIIDAFDNAFFLMPELVEAERFSLSGIASILRLHNRITIVSSNPKFKDLDEGYFEFAKEWNEVRELAKSSLAMIGEPSGLPDKDYL